MPWVCVLLLLTGFYPLARAWHANRRTTLTHAIAWAAVAWTAWLLSFGSAAANNLALTVVLRYLALCLTGCAATMVLGARRPGEAAWNFVVVGLLVTLLLPVAQGWGQPRLDTPWLLFLGATLLFGLLNYVPTRLGLPALFVGWSCARELLHLAAPARDLFGGEILSALSLVLTPWVAFLLARPRPERHAAVDQLWLDFRDRYGVVWGQRVREQCNRALANAGIPLAFTWQGLAGPTASPEQLAEVATTLRAVMKRFGVEQGEEAE